MYVIHYIGIIVSAIVSILIDVTGRSNVCYPSTAELHVEMDVFPRTGTAVKIIALQTLSATRTSFNPQPAVAVLYRPAGRGGIVTSAVFIWGSTTLRCSGKLLYCHLVQNF